MSVLVQYLKFLKSSPGENEKKEKTAELPGYAPSVAGSIDNEKKDEDKLTSSITDHGLASQETPKNINASSAKPVAMRSSSSAAAPAFTQPVANPGRGYNTGVPRPQTQQQTTKIPRVLERIPMAGDAKDPRSGTLLDKQGSLGYSRNTGISDVEGEIYVNGSDVELLGKLGFEYSCEEYLGLEKTSEVLDVYSYIEKVAGVPKEVAKLIDAGQAFSGEYLKDMGYSVPKGYEVKGDLVCPVEKTEQSFQQTGKEEKESSEKTANTQTEAEAWHQRDKKYVTIHVPTLINRVKGRQAQEMNISSIKGGTKTSPGYSDSRLKGTDVKYPIIVDSRNELVDGRHRKIKLLDAGKTKAQVIRINDDDIDACSLHKTAAADPAQTILITGHSGAGKSTLSKQLAEKLNLPLHRVDAQTSWDDLRAHFEKNPELERKALTPGTAENKQYIKDVRKIVHRSLKEINGPAVLEGTQLTTLPAKQLAKYKANILVGGDINQSIAQRLQRMTDKASKKGITFSPEQLAKKREESQLVADSWHPGIEKFKKLPGVINYNHTEHQMKPLVKKLQGLMKKSEALVVSGIHGDEPAGDIAAKKLKNSVDTVTDINPTEERRFEGKDINRHFDKSSEGSIQKKLLDLIDAKKPSSVITLHEDDEINKPYAYSSETMADKVKKALRGKRVASSAHGDATDAGVITRGKNPPEGSLEKALDKRDIPHATIETPSKSESVSNRVKTHLDVVEDLLSKESSEKNAGSWSRSGDNLLNPEGRVMNNTPNSRPMIENPYGDIAGNVGMNALESLALKGAKKLDPLNKDRMSVSLGNRFAATKALKNVAKAVPGVAAGFGVSDARDRWQKEDYTGAMISGLGAAGDVAQLFPHPVAKGVGLTASWGGTAANAARDINRYNNRPVEFRNTPPSLPQPSAPQPTQIQIPSQALAKQSAADHLVTSANIKAVGHDTKKKILEVAFHSGSEYMYKDVPRGLYDRLLKAKSPGKFLNKHIKKDNKFEYEKVAGMPEHIRRAIATGDKALLQAAQGRSVASRAANIAAKKRKLEIAKLLGAEEPKLLQRGEEFQKHFPFSVSHEFEQAKKLVDPSYKPDLSKYLGRI